MLIKDLNHCEEFIAGDDSLLRQLLHPDEANVDFHRDPSGNLPSEHGEPGTRLRVRVAPRALPGEGATGYPCAGVPLIACRYSLCHATVKPGQTTRPHRLRTSEVYYILGGQGLMSIDGESEAVRPGQAIYIPPHSTQYIQNTGSSDLTFLCIVDPAWREEDEEVL